MDDNSIKTRLRVHVACRERQHQEQQMKQHKRQMQKLNGKRKHVECSMNDTFKDTKVKSRKAAQQTTNMVVKKSNSERWRYRKRERTRIQSSKLSNKRTVGNTLKYVSRVAKTHGLSNADDGTCGKACKAQTRKEKQSSQKQAAGGTPDAHQSSQIITSAAALMPTRFQLLGHFPMPEASKPGNIVCLVGGSCALLASKIAKENGEQPPHCTLDKYELPGGSLVWSTPLPPGTSETCWKFCLPHEVVAREDGHRGEIVLWEWDWTYVLDGKGQLLRSFKTVTKPEGMVGGGVVYSEPIEQTEKTQIVVRSLQDHSEVMRLGEGHPLKRISICQEIESGRIAVLADWLTVNVFSSAGEQLASWQVRYTCSVFKAISWFNSNVLCVRQWPGKDIHFHAWDTGAQLTHFRTTQHLALNNEDEVLEVDFREDVANMLVYNFRAFLVRILTYRLQY